MSLCFSNEYHTTIRQEKMKAVITLESDLKIHADVDLRRCIPQPDHTLYFLTYKHPYRLSVKNMATTSPPPQLPPQPSILVANPDGPNVVVVDLTTASPSEGKEVVYSLDPCLLNGQSDPKFNIIRVRDGVVCESETLMGPQGNLIAKITKVWDSLTMLHMKPLACEVDSAMIVLAGIRYVSHTLNNVDTNIRSTVVVMVKMDHSTAFEIVCEATREQGYLTTVLCERAQGVLGLRILDGFIELIDSRLWRFIIPFNTDQGFNVPNQHITVVRALSLHVTPETVGSHWLFRNHHGWYLFMPVGLALCLLHGTSIWSWLPIGKHTEIIKYAQPRYNSQGFSWTWVSMVDNDGHFLFAGQVEASIAGIGGGGGGGSGYNDSTTSSMKWYPSSASSSTTHPSRSTSQSQSQSSSSTSSAFPTVQYDDLTGRGGLTQFNPYFNSQPVTWVQDLRPKQKASSSSSSGKTSTSTSTSATSPPKKPRGPKLPYTAWTDMEKRFLQPQKQQQQQQQQQKRKRPPPPLQSQLPSVPVPVPASKPSSILKSALQTIAAQPSLPLSLSPPLPLPKLSPSPPPSPSPPREPEIIHNKPPPPPPPGIKSLVLFEPPSFMKHSLTTLPPLQIRPFKPSEKLTTTATTTTTSHLPSVPANALTLSAPPRPLPPPLTHLAKFQPLETSLDKDSYSTHPIWNPLEQKRPNDPATHTTQFPDLKRVKLQHQAQMDAADMDYGAALQALLSSPQQPSS